MFELVTCLRGFPCLPVKQGRKCGKMATTCCSVMGKSAGCKTLGGEANLWGKKKKIYLEKSGRKGSHRNVHSSYCGEGKFQITVTFFFSINFFYDDEHILHAKSKLLSFLFKKTAPKKKKNKKRKPLCRLTSHLLPNPFTMK